jgi:hypothetical protein
MYVHADNPVTAAGQTASRHRADVAEAKNTDVHECAQAKNLMPKTQGWQASKPASSSLHLRFRSRQGFFSRRKRTDQPSMFAPGSFFRFPHFTKHDDEVIPQLSPDASFDLQQARPVKARSRHVAEFSVPRLFLIQLHGVEIVEDRVVHVEGRE